MDVRGRRHGCTRQRISATNAAIRELTVAVKPPYRICSFIPCLFQEPAWPSRFPIARFPIVRLTDVHLDMASDAGTVNILRGITLDIAAGEITAVVGPSGAGKSSLMMVAGGLERATSGKVEVAGNDLGPMGDDDRARLRRDHIGIVFQGFHLIPTMTAHENVALPLEFAGRSDAFELAEAALKRVGLGHRIGHYPAQLSGGEQQRVAVARAFVGRPRLMLADEPTGNLDGATGKQVMDLLFEVARADNTTLILITHDMGLAERCDRVLRIADGLLVADDRLRALAAQ
jgi:putative ABC transport system ATP-binding protein